MRKRHPNRHAVAFFRVALTGTIVFDALWVGAMLWWLGFAWWRA